MGAAAAAQIPLTHRRASSALVLITAHESSEKQVSRKRSPENDISDWSKFVRSGATLAVYMPGHNYSDIARRLQSAGLATDTPCIIISRATTKYQRTHRTTVRDLPRAPQLAAPTLLLVGEVVRLADPVDVLEEFVFPTRSQEIDRSIPARLLNPLLDHSSSLRAEEEPTA
jgi:uroporphyrin-III C-methyltransferase